MPACEPDADQNLSVSAAKPQLYGLDMIRGLAAIVVLIYHTDFMFGLRDKLLPGGYLAVDLFFILSGFVIAYNYEQALRTRKVGLTDLAVRRFARLYPLYALTLFAGLFVMTARYHSLYGYFDTGRLAWAAVLNCFVLPALNEPYGRDVLFPFNAASWSIFYEIVANILFALSFAYLPTRYLVVAWLLAGAGLIYAIWQFGNVDLGWGGNNLVAALPRVVFSFLTGMLIFRSHARSGWRFASSKSFWLLLGTAGGVMQGKLWVPTEVQPIVDIGVVFFLLPALVIAGTAIEFTSRLTRIAAFLGETSYAVYLIQGVMIIGAAGITQIALGIKIVEFAPTVGFVFVPLCIALSYMTYRLYEMPARKLFRSAIPAHRKSPETLGRRVP